MNAHSKNQWQFVDEDGTFQLENAVKTSYLYFPLVNEAGLKSSITPDGHGDINIDQNTFFSQPVSVEDLHANRSSRNFWCRLGNGEIWSAFATSAKQNVQRNEANPPESMMYEAGFLWQKITVSNRLLGIRSEITSFVPANEDHLEVMSVKLTNTGEKQIQVTPTMAVPIYGRSADNLRDHRHVTALLHQIYCEEDGVLVKPTLSFDERGHQKNETRYYVFGFGEGGEAPIGYFPTVESFVGEGGSFDWPLSVLQNTEPPYRSGDYLEGYEANGGLRFQDTMLQPGESKTYVGLLGISTKDEELNQVFDRYNSLEKVENWFALTKKTWLEKVNTLEFHSDTEQNDLWLKWVTLQPILRRLFGNSFLPFHDYGRGGRGWRDLWQDAMALLLMDDQGVGEMLFKYFAGVRLDGSNATIIGSKPGEFKADRNNIARVWMDHGVWPLFTTRLYLNLSSDLDFLLREQAYFKDHHIFRSKKLDAEWKSTMGQWQRSAADEIYNGSILEHILIQHLVPFYNVGEHNMILLEGADWNDGLDMAADRGESVAFSAFYAGNLDYLGQLLLKLAEKGIDSVKIAVEISTLLNISDNVINYDSIAAKHKCLDSYFSNTSHVISGEKVNIDTKLLAKDLKEKADWLKRQIQAAEWIQNGGHEGWFNGYYDNFGRPVEGIKDKRTYMTLTGQVFPLMNQIASQDQVRLTVDAVNKYLWDDTVGGPRLNTNFGEIRLDLGRCFGFAYGHKENGAMFTHMAVMYAYALYQNNMIEDGYRVLAGIRDHAQNFPVARMFPGVPEYVEPTGRGVYPFLTGSASWYLFTLLTEAYGVKGDLGDLVIEPKLVKDQFDENGCASVNMRFNKRDFRITFSNPNKLNFSEYQIGSASLNDEAIASYEDSKVILPKEIIQSLAVDETNCVKIKLIKNDN